MVTHGESKKKKEEEKPIEILQGRAKHYLPRLPRASLWAQQLTPRVSDAHSHLSWLSKGNFKKSSPFGHFLYSNIFYTIQLKDFLETFCPVIFLCLFRRVKCERSGVHLKQKRVPIVEWERETRPTLFSGLMVTLVVLAHRDRFNHGCRYL